MKKHHPYHKTTVEHHADGSHTIEHHHESDPSKNVRSGAGDHDAMMDHMMDHTSPMNPGEAEANAGPAAGSPAVGVPAPAATPGA